MFYSHYMNSTWLTGIMGIKATRIKLKMLMAFAYICKKNTNTEKNLAIRTK